MPVHAYPMLRCCAAAGGVLGGNAPGLSGGGRRQAPPEGQDVSCTTHCADTPALSVRFLVEPFYSSKWSESRTQEIFPPADGVFARQIVCGRV